MGDFPIEFFAYLEIIMHEQ
jgi:hypothetical protein